MMLTCPSRFATSIVLRSLAWLIISLVLPAAAYAQGGKAQDAQIPSQQVYRDLVNANTVTVLGASITGAYIKIVDDIAKAVNDGNNLRVLPVVGEGGS